MTGESERCKNTLIHLHYALYPAHIQYFQTLCRHRLVAVFALKILDASPLFSQTQWECHTMVRLHFSVPTSFFFKQETPPTISHQCKRSNSYWRSTTKPYNLLWVPLTVSIYFTQNTGSLTPGLPDVIDTEFTVRSSGLCGVTSDCLSWVRWSCRSWLILVSCWSWPLVQKVGDIMSCCDFYLMYFAL